MKEVIFACIAAWFALQIILLFLFSSMVKNSKRKTLKNDLRKIRIPNDN